MEITGLRSADRTGDWLRLYGRKDMDHSSYSLDLAPSYLHLFESLKKGLAGKRFAGDPDLKQTASWIDLTPISATPGYKRRCHFGTNI